MIERNLPAMEKRTFRPIYSIVASMALCLLVFGCGGGGGSTASSGTPPPPRITPPPSIGCEGRRDEECQIVDLPEEPGKPNTPDNPDELLGIAPDPNDPPGGMPPPPSNPDPMIMLPTGLLNEDKLKLVKAPAAWGSNHRYVGRRVVVGIMEEVNQFHTLFGSNEGSKIHEGSILTSLYPAELGMPPAKYIANTLDELTDNDKRLDKNNVRLDPAMRVKKYPPVPCLLQFEGVNDCPDTSGDTKYFLRLSNGGLGVLPGLQDLRADLHDCPVFNTADGSRELCSEFGALHGTGVAGVAAAYHADLMLSTDGRMSQASFRGVAYGAQVLVYARPLEIAGLPSDFQTHVDYFRNAPKEANVYNFSHTFGTPVTNIDSTFRDAIHGSGFADIAEAIRSSGKPLIAAAGNEGLKNERFPRFPAALPLFFPNLRGQILAVTATSDEGLVTQYANWCGRLPSDWNTRDHGRHYCLAAPGGDSRIPFWTTGPDNNEFYQTTGTSFAAPVVTGAFAILMERFREQLNGEQIILRLVNTADNTGQYSNSNVYGAGMLDIETAIMPVGTNMMSIIGDINEGITYGFDITLLSTSAAFGDALQRAFQTREVVAFDELDAPFWYPLSSLTPTTSSRETLQERHASLFEQDIAPVETAIGGRLALKSSHTGSSEQIDMSLRQPIDSASQAELLLTAGDLSTSPFGLHEDKSFAHPYLGFAGEGIGLGGAIQLDTGRLTAMGFTSGSADVSRDVPIDVHGGLIEYAIEPFAGVEFGMQAGAMVEESRALGLLSEGGFGELGESSTAFAGVSLDSALEDSWRFRASMLFGRTNLDEPSIGLLKTSTTLTSSAFRVAFEGSNILMDADRMDVFVAQPLRIEGGNADFTIPVGRTPAGLVRREQIKGVSLEPGGRELEFGMRYEMQVSEDITATGGLGIVHEGGHSKHTETEVYGLANLRFQF